MAYAQHGPWHTAHGADLPTLDKAIMRIKAGPANLHRILLIISAQSPTGVVIWQGKRLAQHLGQVVDL
ncbi:hypothetical protein ACFWVM_29240 [Nocardia fluminea]|uniref:hypothetical protein n=1 Tax=Nocardia fluminea TaxID=134984 RepID=UPI00364962A5